MATKRTRKPASFTVPDDVASGSPSGWVFRSDATAPAARRRRTTKTTRTAKAAKTANTATPPTPAAGRRPAPSGISLRPLWLPFALAITTIIASLPGARPGADGR